MEEELRALKIKKAMLIDQLKMLSTVSEKFYIQMGKIECEIILLKQKILQETKNPLDQD